MREAEAGGVTTTRDGRDTPTPATAEATAVFDLLSDETRLRIVTTLARDREVDGASGLRFSQLRERVGAADSGRFNYHLGKLRGDLVRKDGERYVLTETGRTYAATVGE
jgi:DNA-binding transcriptional ArsR family regulator